MKHSEEVSGNAGRGAATLRVVKRERRTRVVATKARITARDLWEKNEGDRRLELVDGQVVEMGPPGGIHGRVVALISGRLLEHLSRAGGGQVLTGDVGFVLNLPSDPERVRAPDIAFVSSARLPGGEVPEGFLTGAPDLVVEVLSPSDNPLDVQQKVRDFLEAGSALVWIVAPRAKTVTVYRPDGSARLLRDQEVLDGEAVLPGLGIPLTDLFR
jgi:Uma2 family endonuclease